jgi:carbon monoxide dehydrogenase subunit G
MRSILCDGRFFLALLLSAITSVTSTPAAAARPDLDVQVQMVGDEIRAQVSLFVRASRQHVWEVLTDYERAPQFTPDLQVSKVISRSGDTLRVFQRARVKWGPFSVPIETLREIRLSAPERTEARLVNGSMEKYDAVTELIPEAGGTRLMFRSQAVAGSVLAQFAGESLVKRETEEHFRSLRAEILRRQQLASTTSP